MMFNQYRACKIILQHTNKCYPNNMKDALKTY